MNFTKEEIDLCKEIVKYYQLPSSLWLCKENEENVIFDYAGDFQYFPPYIPLWTWKDAREWLRGKGWISITLTTFNDDSGSMVKFWDKKAENVFLKEEGNTDLEAILKAILEILKEEK
jgi:hypothetical protein